MRGVCLSDEATKVCLASVTKSTTSQYNTYMRRFQEFCRDSGVEDFLHPTLELGIEFLTRMYKDGLSYSTINAARSALSQFIHMRGFGKEVDFGKHALTVKFMKGIFKLNPPKPKKVFTWDVSLVLNLLRSKDNHEITLKELSHKCCMLLALSTGQRAQTLAALNLDNICHNTDRAIFSFTENLKTSRPGFTHSVSVCKFENDLSICPLDCLYVYMDRLDKLRLDNQLFVSHQKPHKAISTQTISRWLSFTLSQAGLSDFTGHSTRSASSSKASCTLNIDSILKTVGWSREGTFAKHYNRVTTDHRKDFTVSVLS